MCRARQKMSTSLWGLQWIFLNWDQAWKVTAADSRCAEMFKAFGHCAAEKIKRHVNILWMPVNKVVLKKKEKLWILCEPMCESGELMEGGCVQGKRETCWDKNSPRESGILIIQGWESLILDQCQRLLESLLTVTNRACMFYNCVAVITVGA